MPSATNNKRRLIVLAWILASLTLAILIFFPRRDLVVRNEREIARLLAHARAEATTNSSISRIESVMLGDNLRLTPEHEVTLAGYSLTLRIQGSAFTIAARPLTLGKTGVFSFYRDRAGVIRFEPGPGKPATDESRQWNPALPQ